MQFSTSYSQPDSYFESNCLYQKWVPPKLQVLVNKQNFLFRQEVRKYQEKKEGKASKKDTKNFMQNIKSTYTQYTLKQHNKQYGDDADL